MKRGYRVIVQEKLDGSNVSVARIGDEIIPLTRAGYRADTSPYGQHHLFHIWVMRNASRFRSTLGDGERIVGEWLLMAHSTRYNLESHQKPFVVFDLMIGHKRRPYDEVVHYAAEASLPTPQAVFDSNIGISIDQALELIGQGSHGAIDLVEGAVWRIERKDEVCFLAKYVRPDKIDGIYFEERAGRPVWNMPIEDLFRTS